MNTIELRFIFVELLFIIVMIAGYRLSRKGKPYNEIIFNLHKLGALGAAVIIGLTVNKSHQSMPADSFQLNLLVMTALCFSIMIISGGFLSIDRTIPTAIKRLHQIVPYLTILSATLTLYPLVSKS